MVNIYTIIPAIFSGDAAYAIRASTGPPRRLYPPSSYSNNMCMVAARIIYDSEEHCSIHISLVHVTTLAV